MSKSDDQRRAEHAAARAKAAQLSARGHGHSDRELEGAAAGATLDPNSDNPPPGTGGPQKP